MSAESSTGQAQHLRTVCRAFDALWDRAVDGGADVVSVDDLLWPWRQLRPRAHKGAGDDAVDVKALVDVLARHPDALVSPLRPIDDEPRGRPLRQQLARAVVDACVLGLEQQKLRHGMTAPAASLKQAFASPDVARDTLVAVRDAAVPSVDVGAVAVDVAVPAGAHVVAGVVARRLQDLLSPYVRKLRVDLALLGRAGAVVDDDDVYRGLAVLNDREPGCVAERRADAGEFGDDGRVFVVDCARLVEDHVDRRARSLIGPLKKAGVVVVGVVDASALAACLNAPRSVQILAPSTTTRRPRAVYDPGGAVVACGGADDAVGSVVDVGFVPDGVDVCVDAAFCWSVVARAVVADAAVPWPTIRLAAAADESAVALEALAAMVPARR